MRFLCDRRMLASSEVATALGRSVGSVKALQHRGLNSLARGLGLRSLRETHEEAVMDDDFRELEPHISDHPFEPGGWPDACGHVDERGWTCGYTRAEHTQISGEEVTPP